MKITLAKLPSSVLGIYGPNEDSMPERTRYLAPPAAASFITMTSTQPIRISDMLRSAKSSLNAVLRGRGAQMPGYSGHNYGQSIDLDVDWCLRRKADDGGGFPSKAELDAFMKHHGWRCHRLDSKLASECWHYNHEIASFMLPGDQRTSDALERKLNSLHGLDWSLDGTNAQRALSALIAEGHPREGEVAGENDGYVPRLYEGAIDGIVGPKTRAATRGFQRIYALDRMKRSAAEFGALGRVTQRILSFVTAEHEVI